MLVEGRSALPAPRQSARLDRFGPAVLAPVASPRPAICGREPTRNERCVSRGPLGRRSGDLVVTANYAYVYKSALVVGVVPAVVVTETWTVPAVRAGEVAVIWVDDLTV
jgi:hypothetical protein